MRIFTLFHTQKESTQTYSVNNFLTPLTPRRILAQNLSVVFVVGHQAMHIHTKYTTLLHPSIHYSNCVCLDIAVCMFSVWASRRPESHAAHVCLTHWRQNTTTTTAKNQTIGGFSAHLIRKHFTGLVNV